MTGQQLLPTILQRAQVSERYKLRAARPRPRASREDETGRVRAKADSPPIEPVGDEIGREAVKHERAAGKKNTKLLLFLFVTFTF